MLSPGTATDGHQTGGGIINSVHSSLGLTRRSTFFLDLLAYLEVPKILVCCNVGAHNSVWHIPAPYLPGGKKALSVHEACCAQEGAKDAGECVRKKCASSGDSPREQLL